MQMSFWPAILIAIALDLQYWLVGRTFCVLACFVVVSKSNTIGVRCEFYKQESCELTIALRLRLSLED